MHRRFEFYRRARESVGFHTYVSLLILPGLAWGENGRGDGSGVNSRGTIAEKAEARSTGPGPT